MRDDRGTVSGTECVVRERGRVCARCDQCRQDPPVPRASSRDRCGGDDRVTRDRMPELDAPRVGDEQTEIDARVEVDRFASCDLVNERDRRACPDRRDDLKGRAPRRREPRSPRKHRIADGVGHCGASRVDHLGHEEWIAARLVEQPTAVEAGACCERLDRSSRQRLESDAVQCAHRGHIAQRHPERVPRAHVILAIGEDHERSRGLDATGQEPDQIDRRGVCPVHVFDHEHTRSLELCADQRENLDRRLTSVECSRDARQHRQEIVNRAERSRCRQRIATADEHARGCEPPNESPHERRLANSGVSADGGHHSSIPGALPAPNERRDRLFSLEKHRHCRFDRRYVTEQRRDAGHVPHSKQGIYPTHPPGSCDRCRSGGHFDQAFRGFCQLEPPLPLCGVGRPARVDVARPDVRRCASLIVPDEPHAIEEPDADVAIVTDIAPDQIIAAVAIDVADADDLVRRIRRGRHRATTGILPGRTQRAVLTGEPDLQRAVRGPPQR
ncbi:MAG TPA: hypothetical protein VLM79_14495, partial [Kofleriaceae bacterium]|nr:hypothetical protein [Kofleriaceae bacterium]